MVEDKEYEVYKSRAEIYFEERKILPTEEKVEEEYLSQNEIEIYKLKE